jgi:hypothetical protein
MFLWKDRGSDFSLGPMKLRRAYLVANGEYKNEQLTRALLRIWALSTPVAYPVKSWLEHFHK